MAIWIKKLHARGLHGRVDITLNLSNDLNILYGRNGSGKTTVMHILANLSNGSIYRFAFLAFEEIALMTGDGKDIRIVRKRIDGLGDCIVLSVDGEQLFSKSVEQCVGALTTGDSPVFTSDSEVNVTMEVIRKRLGVGGVEYFPAFRTMIEAWGTASLEYGRTGPSSTVSGRDFALNARRKRTVGLSFRNPRRSHLTKLARELFGNFIPDIRFPSPMDIEGELRAEILRASYSVADTSQALLSEAFIDAFTALATSSDQIIDSPEIILEHIRNLLDKLSETELIAEKGQQKTDVYYRLRSALQLVGQEKLVENTANVLSVYRKSLEQRIKIREDAYMPIERYINAVNEFLENKKLVITDTSESNELYTRLREAQVIVQYEDRTSSPLASLSSGERHIVCMLYAATHSRKNSLVLIDEPEISLHIDWQRRLVPKMVQQMGESQIIICTHSPEIGADFPENFQEVRPWPTRMAQ